MSYRFDDSRPEPPLIRNLEDTRGRWFPEIEAAAHRAVAAGARRPLTFVGMGASGVVFTDRYKNLAYKAARGPKEGPNTWHSVSEEADWFRSARRTPGMAEHIPPMAKWDAENGVLIRTYVRGRPGSWGDASKLFDIHAEIEKRMIPAGWTSPERKEDSYVVSGGSEGKDSWRAGDFTKAVLVDAGRAQRVGRELVRYLYDVLAGRKKLAPYERLEDLAYYVYRERMVPENLRGTIPVEEVRRALDALRKAGVWFEWEV